jgi:hypothetical protein
MTKAANMLNQKVLYRFKSWPISVVMNGMLTSGTFYGLVLTLPRKSSWAAFRSQGYLELERNCL